MAIGIGYPCQRCNKCLGARAAHKVLCKRCRESAKKIAEHHGTEPERISWFGRNLAIFGK